MSFTNFLSKLVHTMYKVHMLKLIPILYSIPTKKLIKRIFCIFIVEVNIETFSFFSMRVRWNNINSLN